MLTTAHGLGSLLAAARGTIRRQEPPRGPSVQVPRLQRVRREQSRVALVEERRPIRIEGRLADAERASPIPQYNNLLEAAPRSQLGESPIGVAAVASELNRGVVFREKNSKSPQRMYLPSTRASLASLRCSATKSLSRAPVQSLSS